MKFFIFSKDGDSAGIANHLKNEGNEVSMYIDNKNARETLKGMVSQVPTVASGLAQNPSVVLFDMVGYGDIARRIKKLGYNVIGSGSYMNGKDVQDCMELDRTFGQSVMKSANMITPHTVEFRVDQAENAIKFVQSTKKRYVLKPDNNKVASSTYVSENWEDAIAAIEGLKNKKNLKASDCFILQEHVDGIEISTEMWFSKGRPIYPANGTMETKKFLVGNLGPNTGCQTSLVWFYDRKEPKIVQMTLKKLYTFCKLVDYTGPVDINCIVSKKDHRPYGLEWTSRLGYSAIYALLRLLDLKEMPLGECLYQMATGDLKEFICKTGFGYSMRVSIPPYPLAIDDERIRMECFKRTDGLPVKFTGDEKSFFPLGVRMGTDGMETVGFDGVIGEITGYGNTIEEAKNDAHTQFKKLEVPDKQARLDGWKRPLKEIPILESWGYEMPPTGQQKESENG